MLTYADVWWRCSLACTLSRLALPYSPPKLGGLRAQIAALGYNVSHSHCDPEGIKAHKIRFTCFTSCFTTCFTGAKVQGLTQLLADGRTGWRSSRMTSASADVC